MSIVHGSRRSVKYGHSLRSEYSSPETLRKVAINDALAGMGPCVYVIRFDDLVKIGWTANLGQRLIALRVPRTRLDRVLLVKPGTLADEHALHERFAAHRGRGREYFHAAPDLMAWVNGCRAEMGLPPIP